MILMVKIKVQTGEVQRGTSDWAVRSRDSSTGSNSMDSGYRNSNPVPSDTYIYQCPVGILVEAELDGSAITDILRWLPSSDI